MARWNNLEGIFSEVGRILDFSSCVVFLTSEPFKYCCSQIGDVLSSAESSQAEKSMGAWLETIRTWLHTMETINDDVLPQG